MSALRWEWSLADGRRVAATLDVEGGVESVLVDGQLVARGPRGSHPEGYPVGREPPIVVEFEAHSPICVLRVAGDEVAPATWPGRERLARKPPAAAHTSGVGAGRVVTVLVVVALLVTGAFAVRMWGVGGATGEALAAHRAGNGLFVARYPVAFAARTALAPPGASALLLEDRDHDAAIVVVAVPLGTLARDPWLVQKKLHGEAVATLPRGDRSYEETARREGTCLGEAGAVVLARATTTRGTPAKVWSCGLVRDDAAFLFAYTLPEDASDEDEARVRRIVDATELTRLADVPGR